jgi:hypothetical protein
MQILLIIYKIKEGFLFKKNQEKGRELGLGLGLGLGLVALV